MADQKVTQLNAIAAATVDDLIYLVEDPLGVPLSKKITFDNFQKSITDVGNIATGTWSAAFPADSIDADALNWGVGVGQISAVDVPIADAGAIITGTEVETALQENRTAIDLNTLKETDVNHNVTTDLSAGARTATTIKVDSSDGTDATLVEADTTNAGILGSDKWDEIVANSLKETDVNHNTITNITVVEAPTNVDIQSSDGSNDTIAAADVTNAGVMTTTMYDEHVLNNAKETDVNHNVTTDLSAGARTATTIKVDSSDGTDATLVEADTTNAGILGSDKWDEIVANTAASHAESHSIVSHNDTTATGAELDTLTGGGDTTLHDHDGITENTTSRHTQNTDTALGSGCVAADHGTAATDQVINICYGTGDPPTANTTTIGTLFVKYTA